MEGVAMTPTRNSVIAIINDMPESQFKKVAAYVSVVQKEDRVATASEIENLTQRFNAKYEKAFRALAK